MTVNAAYKEQTEELLDAILGKLDVMREHIQDIIYETNPGLFTLALDNVALYVIHATESLDMVLRNIDIYGIAPKEDADEE